MSPSEEYQRRLSARRQKVEHYKKLDLLIGNLRLGAGIILFVLAGLAVGPHIVSGWWVLVPAGVFIILVIQHERVRSSGRQAQRSASFYERGLARIEDRWIGSGDPGFAYADENHPYAIDLDLFGKGSLFELLSAARTRAGERTLASWLKGTAPTEEIAMRQQAVEELRGNIDLREDLAVLGEDVRAAIHPDWMRRWGTAPEVDSRAARLVAPILSALMIASIVYYFAFYGSGWIVIAALAAGGGFGLHFRKRVRDVTDAVADPAKDLDVLSLVLARLERESWQCERLQKLRDSLGTVEQPASRAIRRLVRLIEWLNSRLDAWFAVFAPFLLWATQFAFAIETWRAKHGR